MPEFDDLEANETPLSGEELAALARYRSRVYEFLGAMYNRLPDDRFVAGLQAQELAALLDSLAGVEDWPAHMREGLQLLQGYTRACAGRPPDEVRTELAVERTHLLRGIKAGYSPLPPYESVYAGTGGQPLMQTAMAVRQIYADAGVGLPGEVQDQPDFIGFELDFMRHLATGEARCWAAGAEAAARTTLTHEQRFLEEHILRWVPGFCDILYAAAHGDFFRGIARMTAGFIAHDARQVADLLG